MLWATVRALAALRPARSDRTDRRVHHKWSQWTLADRHVRLALAWWVTSADRGHTVANQRPTAAAHTISRRTEIRAVSPQRNITSYSIHLLSNIISHNPFLSIALSIAGYSPHPGYGMVVQSDYPPAGYHGYGPAAYQCSNPYATAVGPGGYPTPVSGGYSPSPATCYSMPPPQHIPQHDKTKDG